jgi:hypothetical protein
MSSADAGQPSGTTACKAMTRSWRNVWGSSSSSSRLIQATGIATRSAAAAARVVLPAPASAAIRVKGTSASDRSTRSRSAGSMTASLVGSGRTNFVRGTQALAGTPSDTARAYDGGLLKH